LAAFLASWKKMTPGQGDVFGGGSANFPGVTPGVYQLTAEAEPLYQSNMGVVPTGRRA
jgi:hypothetical protein